MAEAAVLVKEERYEEAEQLYRRILNDDRSVAQAWINLGVICGLTGRLDERIEAFDQAIRADASSYSAWFNKGVALTKQPNYAAAHDCFARAADLAADQPLAHAGLGLCRGMLGDLEAALAAYRQAVDLGLKDPKQAFFQLGRELFLQEDFHAAIVVFRAGIRTLGDHIDALLLLGMALQRVGELQQAADVLLYLLSIDSEHDEGLTIYGHILAELDSYDEAFDLYERALAANPKSALAANLLGQLHADFGRTHLAIPLFKQALESDPKAIGVLVNLASAYRAQGKLDECINTFRELLEEKPDLELAIHGLLFSYSLGGSAYSETALREGQAWWARYRTRSKAATSATQEPPVVSAPVLRQGQRLRIGILSAEFTGHCVTSFLNSYLYHYNRDAFEVEAITPVYLSSAVEAHLRRHVSDVLKVYDVSTEEARRRLQERNYDLILETSGFTRNSALRLLSERCAPVQCHYIGYHATLALDTIDYFIGDENTAAADLQSQFVETLWRLPRPWLACTPSANFPLAHSTVNCPHVVLGSFNQLAKVRSETLEYWAAALHAVPSARMVIKDRLTADPGICTRIQDGLQEHGICTSRIDFKGRHTSWNDHLATYNEIDIALDTTPWSSATTGFDALAMGVPLVAIRGNAMVSRMSSSLVRGLDRPHWEASNPDAYAEVVRNLADRKEALRHDKPRFQQEVLTSSLYDSKDLARHLDQALEWMTEKAHGR
jgi:protein O-GlcNAc transferase